jgi:hypothetical protein
VHGLTSFDKELLTSILLIGVLPRRGVGEEISDLNSAALP